jgi:hypothetical protein
MSTASSPSHGIEVAAACGGRAGEAGEVGEVGEVGRAGEAGMAGGAALISGGRRAR